MRAFAAVFVFLSSVVVVMVVVVNVLEEVWVGVGGMGQYCLYCMSA